LTMLIPEHGTFNYDGKSPNFVLFFDELYFKKSIEYIGGGLGSTGDRLFSMDVELQYFIWDNYYQQIVSYGKLTKTVNTFEYPKKDEYLKVLDSFASSIIMESPLVYRQLEIE